MLLNSALMFSCWIFFSSFIFLCQIDLKLVCPLSIMKGALWFLNDIGGGREQSSCLKTLLSVQNSQIGFKQFARAFFSPNLISSVTCFKEYFFFFKKNSAFREMQTLPSVRYIRVAITKLCCFENAQIYVVFEKELPCIFSCAESSVSGSLSIVCLVQVASGKAIVFYSPALKVSENNADFDSNL